MEAAKRPRGRPRKVAPEPVEAKPVRRKAPITATAAIPVPMLQPAYAPVFGHRPRPQKRRRVLHPFQG